MAGTRRRSCGSPNAGEFMGVATGIDSKQKVGDLAVAALAVAAFFSQVGDLGGEDPT